MVLVAAFVILIVAVIVMILGPSYHGLGFYLALPACCLC